MVACPQCTARFASKAELEREWYLKHLDRAHGESRNKRYGRNTWAERSSVNLKPAA